MTGSTALAEVMPKDEISAFRSIEAFREAREMAESLANSQLVPKEYQGKPDDCLLALEIAQRLGASALMVMQSLDIIHGRLSWRSQFVIAGINRHPRFAGNLNWRWTGERNTDSWGAIAFIRERETGEILEGPEITIAIAKKEGWYSRNGSKWQTIPELMLMYRSASWFASIHCPEVKLGIMTREEALDVPRDMGDAEVVGRAPPEPPKRKSETQQRTDKDEQQAPEAKAEKPKGGKKKAKEPEPEPPQDQSNDQGPSADKLIEKIAKAESRQEVAGIVGDTDHLSEADRKRVVECGRSRWTELKPKADNGNGPSQQGGQQGFELPEDYGAEK